MSVGLSDGTLQKPHKRTGVWSVDAVKQKSSNDSNQKQRFSRKGVAEISLTGDDDDLSTQIVVNSRTLDDVSLNRVNCNLLGLSALKSLNDVNVSMLLDEFNEADEVKEDDSPWTKDLLFADIKNTLDENASATT